MTHVFAYGTLMCADVMRAACGGLPAAEPAQLPGFSRHPVAGEDYPGIVEAEGARVDGLLYRDASPEQLARLDAFEGDQYRRETVCVRLPDGSSVAAQTYVFVAQLRHLLEPGDWDYDAFLRERRQRFERRYVGFDRV